jgi:hypothetical protein
MFAAKVVTSWATDDVKVYLYEVNQHSDQISYFKPGPNGMIGRTHKRSDVIPEDMAMVMPAEALKAIVSAASESYPPSEVMDRHLKDAMTIRDRLLAMIEKRGLS